MTGEKLAPITNYDELLKVQREKLAGRQLLQSEIHEAMVAGGLASCTWDEQLEKMTAEQA